MHANHSSTWEVMQEDLEFDCSLTYIVRTFRQKRKEKRKEKEWERELEGEKRVEEEGGEEKEGMYQHREDLSVINNKIFP